MQGAPGFDKSSGEECDRTTVLSHNVYTCKLFDSLSTPILIFPVEKQVLPLLENSKRYVCIIVDM